MSRQLAMSWQLKGWLLLTAALLATALVASTAGAGSMPSPHTAVGARALAGPSSTATAAQHRQLEKRITTPASPWYDG